MPYINIQITDEQVTKEQKQALIAGATQLMVDVLNKNPATTFVIINEINTDNWGIGFDQVTELRKAQALAKGQKT
ncbi:tautomerase family protein [Thalassolituus sp. LLYu03]|uniref:tautomerase family protein n=1 Tax=Thalassolituus sp. LLYu03 TaxID=3421656 RepID=UPI003D2DA7F3